MVALPKTPLVSRMTVTEFLGWPDDPTGQLWQLIDGEPVAMAPASQTHGAIQNEIGRLIGNHLRAHARHCRVVTAPGVTPRVRSDWNVRIPDLAVSCGPPSAHERLLPDPVLCIEILSPSNEAETWANVWAYASIPSVLEILVVQSLAIEAELLRRLPDGAWPRAPERLAGASARVRLDSIGGSFALADFYDTTELAAAARA